MVFVDLDAIASSISSEMLVCEIGVLIPDTFSSGVMLFERSRFFAKFSPELIGKAFFLGRPLPRRGRPRLI